MGVNVKRALWVALLLVCAGLVWFALRGNAPLGEVPMSDTPSVAPRPASTPPSSPAAQGSSAAPSPSSSTPPSAAPVSETATAPATSAAPEAATAETEDQATPEAAPATTAAPEAAPAAELLTGPAAPWEEITAAPVHVEVRRGEETLVAAPIELTQLDEDEQIDPEPHTVGWYGPPQWATVPGERSSHPGILAGHVVYYGLKDVFWRLDEVRTGDVVVLTYDDGTQAAFRASRDAVSVDKSALTKDPSNEWAWELPEPGNAVTLITCDLVPGTGMAGNAFNNWVVQATRVE